MYCIVRIKSLHSEDASKTPALITFYASCTLEAQTFYADCENAVSISHVVRYLDKGPYPSYNCLVNRNGNKCSSNCTRLADSGFKLMLTQKFTGHLETAWTGLSKCSVNPNIGLIFNQSIESCTSRGFKFKNTAHLIIFIFYLIEL